MTAETYLTLSRAGFPPHSARGCTQELYPLLAGELRRTVNGVLAYAGADAHHKYRSIIRCQDKTPPAFDGLWRGAALEVGCIQRFIEKFQGASCILTRLPVPASLVAKTFDGQEVTIGTVAQRAVTFTQTVRGGFISYRPLLNMRLLNFHLETDEWGMTVGWKLWLEEI